MWRRRRRRRPENCPEIQQWNVVESPKVGVNILKDVCLFVDCCSARRTDCWADRGLGEDYNTDFCHSLCDLYHLGLLTNQPRILEIFSLLKQRFCFISIITIKAPIALLTAAGNILFSDLPSGKTRIRQLPTAKILFCKLTGCSLNSPN